MTQAKARFSEVVDRAREQGPQAITKNGRPAVVVVSIEEWIVGVSLAEIWFGIERLALGRRRARLDRWLREELPERCERRIVPVDERVANACGPLAGTSAARLFAAPSGVLAFRRRLLMFSGSTASVPAHQLETLRA